MTRTLETLQDVLWEEFEAATARHEQYTDPADVYYHHHENARIQNRMALAQLAQAIVTVENKIEERSGMSKGLKG